MDIITMPQCPDDKNVDNANGTQRQLNAVTEIEHTAYIQIMELWNGHMN